MMTTETNELREHAKQRTEWLKEFQEAHWETCLIFREMDMLINACYVVGNDRMGDMLREFAEALQDRVKTMDDAVSRSIHEQAQDSWNNIGRTFKALLENVSNESEPEHEH